MAKWKSELRQLSKQPPSKNTKNAVLDAMRGKMEYRAAALLMVASAEAALQGAIAYALGLTTPNQFYQLFDHDGPFATFHQRIVGATAMNLIGSITSNNASVIRNVRNVFAHAMAPVSFSDEPIKKACDAIELTDTNRFFIDGKRARKRARFKFGYACNEIYQGVLNRTGSDWITMRAAKREILPNLPILR